jgi:hypothetical protein
MYEYRCTKCKKKYEHYLKIHQPCNCGGKLKEIIKNVEWPLRKKIVLGEISTTFIPVRSFGGFGSIWYYRRKPRKKIKKIVKNI